MRNSNRQHWILIRLSLAIVFLIIIAACHRSNTPSRDSRSGSNISSSADVIQVRGRGAAISPGNDGEWEVTIHVEPGYHVNANPATFSYLIPTEVIAGTAEGLRVDAPVYPAGEKKKFQFADDPLAVYEGDVLIKLPLHVEPNVQKGSRSLPLTIRVQACDDEKCFPPATINTPATIGIR